MKTLSAILIVSLATLGASLKNVALADEPDPKCHVYIKTGGTFVDVRKQVATQYSSSQICDSTLKSFVCYSYYEPQSTCATSNTELVDQFLKEARSRGRII